MADTEKLTKKSPGESIPSLSLKYKIKESKMAAVLCEKVMLFSCLRSQGINRSSALAPLLIIQVRTKVSKSSPFGKRGNPMAKQREDVIGRRTQIDMAKNKTLDRPMNLDSPGAIISNYAPLQKKAFFLTPTGIKQRWEAFKMGLWTVYSLAFVKKHCKPFKVKEFAQEAQDIFIEVNKALERKDKKRLQELATGAVYHALRQEYFPADRHLHWRLVSTVERPRIVHVRVAPVGGKENLFAQITVKLHTEQVMAVKDQYGRHVKGDANHVKQVVDFVIFEKHLVGKYSSWRVCGKPPLRQEQLGSKQQDRMITDAATSTL